MSSPQLHVFDKVDYTQQRVVDLPVKKHTPLEPSSLRIQTKLTTLTTNNLTYARNGHIRMLGWWDVYPIPEETPAPYNDTEKYCAVAGWGYVEVVESNVPEIPAGHLLYGFVPISTAIYDISIKKTDLKNQIFVTSPHRQHLWPVYNRYQVRPPLSELEASESKDSLGWDTIQALWGTSYNISLTGFAWQPEYQVSSLGVGDWTPEESNLTNTTVILLNASGKTALGLAYALRHTRPKKHQPLSIVGVGSPASISMLETCGLYDKAVLNTDSETFIRDLEASDTKPRRIYLFDFGSRPGAQSSWSTSLTNLSTSSSIPYTFIGAGSVVQPMHPTDSLAAMQARMTPGFKMVNASNLREKGIEVGGEEYFEEFYKAFGEFKKQGGYPGVKLEWRMGLGDWTEDWGRLCRDEVKPGEMLVYRF